MAKATKKIEGMLYLNNRMAPNVIAAYETELNNLDGEILDTEIRLNALQEERNRVNESLQQFRTVHTDQPIENNPAAISQALVENEERKPARGPIVKKPRKERAPYKHKTERITGATAIVKSILMTSGHVALSVKEIAKQMYAQRNHFEIPKVTMKKCEDVVHGVIRRKHLRHRGIEALTNQKTKQLTYRLKATT